jgi:glycosyltransferase involved in cell wall biosynthesis
MKVALVHDYLKEPGGAEVVLMALKKIYPDAPVYTAFAFPEYFGRFKEEMEKWDIRQSFGRFLPFLPKFLSYYTILSPLFFKSFDLSEYDLVIVSQTGGYFPNGVKIGPKTVLVTYCHTPPRFLYGYDTATRERNKWYWKPVSEIANHILRMVDFNFAQKPHYFVANSRNVANRIRKFYRRDSIVVYPPIEIRNNAPSSPPLNTSQRLALRVRGGRESYYLIVSRIIGSKNIELAVEAANKYKFNLIVAGKAIGENGKGIAEQIKGETITYLGEVTEEKKEELLSNAKGFLALEKDADFGMTAVEPQVYGTPVVAYRNGGYLEAVIDGKTGVFFDQLTAEGLWNGIQRFNKVKWDRELIKKESMNFSGSKFVKFFSSTGPKAWKVDNI